MLKSEQITRIILTVLTICSTIVCCSVKKVDPFDMESLPAPPEGMQRFVGISNDRCDNEWDAYQQAWGRAMERAARFASTRITSKIVNWGEQRTQQMLLEGRVLGVQDVKTHFESQAKLKTNVVINKTYETKYLRKQNSDGTWKAKVYLLADEEKLLTDARKALEKLEKDIESARSDAGRSSRLLKAQILDKLKQAQAKRLTPEKLRLLGEALIPYNQYLEAKTALSEGDQARAKGDGILALMSYERAPEISGDAPGDDTHVPDLQTEYQETWTAIVDAAGMLESAKALMESDQLASAKNTLDEFHQRMGSATGPFTNAITGESISLSPLPSLLKEQLDALMENEQRADQIAEAALADGDILTAVVAWYRAVKLNSENSQAKRDLENAMQILASATLEAKPENLSISYRVPSDEKLIVRLKASSGQYLSVPVNFRFKEDGIDAQMITNRADGVSSDGAITIRKIRQAPDGVIEIHLLATPILQEEDGVDEALTARLNSIFKSQTLSIPVALRPTHESLTLCLDFNGDGMAQERVSNFQKGLTSGLRQRGYRIDEKSAPNSLEIKGKLGMISAPVGSLVTVKLSAALSFWHENRPLAENVRINSGAQVSASEDESFSSAMQIMIQKCETEIGNQIERIFGN